SRATAWARSICSIPTVTLPSATLRLLKRFGNWQSGQSKAEGIGHWSGS
ncbi:uncharacterized protein METZ01_LOCUS170000, partial [marine metagenome]